MPWQIEFFGDKNMLEHPFGWLSLLPPVTAILLAIITKRVVFSLLLGIFAGAFILQDWDPISAVQHMCTDHLWSKLIDTDTQHVFFFTILMGVMVGMINRAAGMRGLVNALTPLASNRKRGQLTTWFLGLFVFFDDYANTMLLGNTLKPLTDKLKIAREKLAYLVDSTAAPVAGLALISTWVAGEIGYVQEGLDRLPLEDGWNAFGIFISSIPYRFYVIFALLFVPIVALLSRDFGPMLAAEQKAVAADSDRLSTGLDNRNGLVMAVAGDPTAPDDQTPARWFNAVIPVLVTVSAVVYFLYASGSANTDSTSLMDIFGEADSYSSLLWGALWGATSAYVLLATQRLISLKELHQAGANGARLMVPALLVLWLAQSMSSLTKNENIGNSNRPIVEAMYDAGKTDPSQIIKYVASHMDFGDQELPYLIDTAKTIVDLQYQNYLSQCENELEILIETMEMTDRQRLRTRMELVEEQAWKNFVTKSQPILENIQSHEAFKAYLKRLNMDVDEASLDSRIEFAGKFTSTTEMQWTRWQTNVANDERLTGEMLAIAGDEKAAEKEGGERSALEAKAEIGNLLLFIEGRSTLSQSVVSYDFVFRNSRLYTGDFLSERLAALRDGDGFLAENFVPLLPTLVFVLASIVAFSTGTSWGTMGIVMPLVIPLTYSQLAIAGETVGPDDAILLCCVGSVLAGAIFGDHCSPISDTTVLSSQASGCDHVAHVRTQLPYAIVVGLVSIVCGTLPIGYGVPVWILLPLGIVALVGILYLIGTRVEDP
ncbi:hypothetical protein OAF34_06130 [Pirellulaceae bacterium]|jgi:Na+/H+ antiporter NhaC|nr:hypothetical protein [Pirellulaceae bacterium]